MGKRGTVTDYAGNELHAGDLVAYSARQGNRVRMADAIVLKVTTRPGFGGRLTPVLKVKPTGIESGFTARQSERKVWVGAEHVRLVVRNFIEVEPDPEDRW
jgi:hypothetical protein